jgi:hypothetical protein
MAGQLMPAGDDVAHDRRITFGDPSQRKKSGLDSVLVEQGEDARNIAFYPAFTLVPISPVDVGRERRDLKIILDIDGQRVGFHALSLA